LASKPVATVFAGLTSKPVATVSSGLASKPTVTVFTDLASKPVATVSPSLASKPVVGFLVEPQNQGGERFPGLCLKTGSSALVIWVSKSPRQFLGLGLKIKQASVCRLRHKTDGGREGGAGHMSRSSSLLGVEESLTMVFQSGLKTCRAATMGGARDTIAEVVSEAS
jgi:hypothetical protein